MDNDRRRLDAMATLLRSQLSMEQGETARLTHAVEQLQGEVGASLARASTEPALV